MLVWLQRYSIWVWIGAGGPGRLGHAGSRWTAAGAIGRKGSWVSAIEETEQQRRAKADVFFMESLTICENGSSREEELHLGGMPASLSSSLPRAGVIGWWAWPIRHHSVGGASFRRCRTRHRFFYFVLFRAHQTNLPLFTTARNE